MPGVEGNRGPATILVSILAMRTALADLYEPEPFQQSSYLAGLQDRYRAHAYAT